MKRIHYLLLELMCMIILLCGCAIQPGGPDVGPSQVPIWQEQYDLGMRYLSEGNYEGAILAFTAAIEIDPKRAPAYVGRGDAYMLSGESENNLAAAKADYEKAIELDEASADAYLGLADVYICKREYEKALKILRYGLERSNNDQRIIDKISDIEMETTQALKTWGTKSFSDYSPDQQQYIENLINAIENNDRETAWKLLEGIDILKEEYVISFVSHEYRVQIYNWNSTDPDSIGGNIEIHPKDGQGFFCEHIESEDGHFNEMYMTGECNNWNWNGSFEKYWRYYYPDDSDTITVCSGLMRDGLLDGTVKDTTKRTYVGKTALIANDWEKTYDEPYDMGVRIRSGDSTTIYSALYGFSVEHPKAWDWSVNH